MRWTELPGFDDDTLHEAWNAWLKSCERPGPTFAPLCPEVRRLSIGSPDEQRAWMVRRLQPYRVEPLQGPAEGLLTGYYEPLLEATRDAGPPTVCRCTARRPTWPAASPGTRARRSTPCREARAALRGREIAWLADPVDALVLQIQGSGRLRITEPDGSATWCGWPLPATNEHPYRSVGSWLLQQGAIRDASWPGIKAWAAQNPQRVNEMLWSNPRTVFFREEPLTELDAGVRPARRAGRAADAGPLDRGRQGQHPLRHAGLAGVAAGRC